MGAGILVAETAQVLIEAMTGTVRLATQSRSTVSRLISVFVAVASALSLQAAAVAQKSQAVAATPNEAEPLNRNVIQLLKRGQYDAAIPLAERALSIGEKALGPEHRLVAAILNNLAAAYEGKSDYARAERLYERALRIVENTLGPEHPETTPKLNGLAGVYAARGEPARAVPLLLRALRIDEKAYGPEHPEVATDLNDLAGVYDSLGDYSHAEPLYLRALRIDEKALGPDDPQVAATLNNLAELYRARWEHLRAEPLYLRALRIWEKASGPEHPHVASCLNNLAVLYQQMGDYRRAEPLLRRSLLVRERTLGSQHPDVATALNNLAEFYRSVGDYQRALPLFERSLHLSQKVLGSEHPQVASILNNLGTVHMSMGDDGRAEAYHLQSMLISLKTRGGEPLSAALNLNNLGNIYLVRGNHALAEKSLENALQIIEAALGPDHPEVALALNNLAGLSGRKGDYRHAEKQYARALRIWEKALGPDHPWVAAGYSNLAWNHDARGQKARALEMLSRGADVLERSVTAILALGAEEQKRAYFATLSGDTDSTVSFHVGSAARLPAAARLALTTVLRRKGRVLESMRDLYAVLRRHADPKDLATIDELARLRAELAMRTLRGSGKVEDLQTLAGLRENERRLEEALADRYATLGVKHIPVTLAAVQAAIPAGAALAEYFVFKPFDKSAQFGSRWGKPRYVVYILRPRGEPSWVDLGESEPIDQLAKQVRRGLAAGDRGGADAAKQLTRLVVSPVRKLLGEITDVFLSPDGELNLVPFGALPDEEGKYLIQRFRFTYLSSGRDLLRFDLRADTLEAPAIMAAPDYGDARASRATTEDKPARGLLSADMPSITFAPLPGTLAEGKRLLRALPGGRLLTGGQATEGALKAMRGPRILHLATHGFFLDDLPAPENPDGARGIGHLELAAPSSRPLPRPLAKVPATAGHDATALGRLRERIESPLLRSGLALAGANRRSSGRDDGILTAMEAMTLDLVGTQLVVLSACETGLGDVRNGDGVFGLRRALVLAGAETQLMTLWRIDDETTTRFMAEYYDRIGTGLGRSEALRAAAVQMLSDPKTASPKYWAPFLVSGDPRPLHGGARGKEAGREGPSRERRGAGNPGRGAATR